MLESGKAMEFLEFLVLRCERDYSLNGPFPSYPSPLFQNESTCETIHMKMCSTFTSIFMQVKVIFISMVSHVDSFRN